MGLRYLGNINKPGYNPLASNITTGVNVVQYQGIFTTQQQLQAITTGQWVTDPVFDYSTLLLQADSIANGSQNNTFLDSSTNNFTITRNGNTTQGAFSPFSAQQGAWSVNNTTDENGIKTSSSVTIGTSVFTMEFWIYFTSTPSTGNIGFCQDGTNNSGIFYGDFTTFGFAQANVGFNVSGSPGFTLNAWYHVAVARDSSNRMSVWVNGRRIATGTGITTNYAAAPMAMGGSSFRYQGYCTNGRLVIGTAVYDPTSTTITVPTSPLTAITNTSVLLGTSNRFNDLSSNNYAITVTGTPSVQAFSPFAPQFQYTATGTGGSGYFDGSGDYLQTPSSANLGLATGDFTVECWYYQTSRALTNTIIAPSTDNLNIYINTSGILGFYDGAARNSSITVPLNTWSHIALVRSGSTATLYYNGVSAVSQANTINYATASWYIGRNAGGTDQSTGYCGSARIIKGTALYTGTFTPPTAPLTAVANTQLLLNFTNAGILDGTMKNNLETVGNASVSTSVVKYGSGSMYFDGTGDYLLTPTNVPALNLGTGDFTMECWFYLAGSTSSDQQIFSFAAATVSANTDWGFGLSYYGATYSGKVYGFFYSGTTGYEVPSSTALTANTWNHIAYTRLNGIIYLYINGVQQGSLAANVAVNFNTGWALKIGYGHSGATRYLNGYLDDVRITKGIARYTQNFIPPSVALPRQ